MEKKADGLLLLQDRGWMRKLSPERKQVTSGEARPAYYRFFGDLADLEWRPLAYQRVV